MLLSAFIREASFFSQPLWVQEYMADQYTEARRGSVIIITQAIYATPSKAQGTFQKRGGKNVIAWR